MTEPAGPRAVLPYSTQALDESDIDAVVEVLRGNWLTTGPTVAAFEQQLAAVGGARYAVAVNSGTAALHCAYAAAGLGAGDDIVTSPLTFVATASMALFSGARVRFADVLETTGCLDPAAAAAAIGDNTKLVVAVDYAGHPADYDALRAVAAQSAAKLVADAAHSFGATYRGRPVGSLADMTTLSFHPVKTFTTGEGGACLTDDPDWLRRAMDFRNHGIVREPERQRHPSGDAWYYEVQSLGYNYRIPDILCALGISQLGKLDGFLARRREIARIYQSAFADVPSLIVPFEEAHVESSWHLYALRVREPSRRSAFFEFLRGEGIGAQVHYIPVHLHPAFEALGYREGICPQAERFAAQVVSIPLFPTMQDHDVERVIDTVRRAAAAVL